MKNPQVATIEKVECDDHSRECCAREGRSRGQRRCPGWNHRVGYHLGVSVEKMKPVVHRMLVSRPSTAEKGEAGSMDFGRRAGRHRILCLILEHVDFEVPAG